MSKRREKISAFLDDDMHPDELMSFSLSAEADDARTALRYQMLGDAMRGEVSDSSFIDISQVVREALADENIADQIPDVKSESSVSEKPGLFDLSAWFKPVAGLAVAASVAVVMVVTVNQQDSTSIAPVATNIDTQPVLQLAVDAKNINAKTINTQATDMDPYINQHLEFATQDTLQGRLPYVRAVSFDSNTGENKAGKNKAGKNKAGQSTTGQNK